MKSLIITGPESTGKTSIAKYLADELAIPWIKEHSRSYLEDRGANYSFDDLAIMAKEANNILKQSTADYLIQDTDILSYKIWSEIKYNKTEKWIDQNLKLNQSMLYLLCYPDIEWESDPLRESPNDRHLIFTKFENLLIHLELDYFIISGSKKVRLETALDLASNYFPE